MSRRIPPRTRPSADGRRLVRAQRTTSHAAAHKLRLRDTLTVCAVTAALALALVLMHTASSASAASAAPPAVPPAASPASAPGLGLIQSNGRLLLTPDGGGHWTNVTPRGVPSSSLGPAYFTSATTGWVAAATYGPASSTLRVLHTSDGGTTWQTTTLPSFPWTGVSPRDFTFTDAQHGWLVASLPHGLMSNPATLLITGNGGQTWSSAALPFAGTLTFADASTGWLVGSQSPTASNQIDVTHDGGRTWQQQQLSVTAASRDAVPVIGSPIFFTRQDGTLAVNFGVAAVLYRTHDGGATWTEAASFALSDLDTMAAPISAASGISAWVSLGHQLLMTHDAGRTWSTLGHSSNLLGVERLSFASATVGWALVGSGHCAQFKSACAYTQQIVQTADGGRTWNVLPATNLLG